jgi:AcrR family transcriptional regulator
MIVGMARTYRLKARAERQQETRRRIVEAAVELHRTVGPARTEISAVAELAGVERVTVYRHFPDLEQLLSACSLHYRAANPPPDVAALRRIRDPRARLGAGLDAAYAYYERNREMMANVLRDAAVMPVGGGFLAFQTALAETLGAGWKLRGRARQRLRAALRLAADFDAWHVLAVEQGLPRAETIAVMAGLVESAATPGRASGA